MPWASSSARYSTRPETVACICGAAEVLLVGHFAGGRVHQRRAGQRRHAVLLDADHIVGHAGHVGAARRGRPVQHGNGRYAGGAQPRQAVEHAAAGGPQLDLVFHQVRAGAFHQMDERQFLAYGDLQGAERLVQRLPFIAPALIPLSSTKTMQRTPLTKPMPTMALAPGMLVSGLPSSTR